ncbi:MAG: hypothetical protein FIA95_03975 [Gemmatimonadetes bacterium]|nr:hypothetical protein [Gemmatimonadota bacterium]
MKIPFVSIRFRTAPLQDWGIQVARETRRTGHKQAWAPLTQNITSTLAQSGRLVGLEDLRARRLVEANPVLTGTRLGSDESGVFLRDDPTAAFGFNGRLGLTQNLVLEGTANPDFSQVEADAGQISVNERFALFFPEKRAFFLEGGEIFSTPARLVHTRQIADPVAGAKLTGKAGAFQVGYLGALDESPATMDDGTGKAVFNLVRARRDVGAASTVGFLYTDRTLTDGSGAYNRLLAGDARLVFGGRYSVTGQVAGSLTREEDEAGNDGLKPLLNLDVQRSGRGFSWNANLTDVAPDFSARSGFVTRVGDTEMNATVSFTRFGRPGALLESAGVRIISNNFFRHDEFWAAKRPFEAEIELWPTFQFRGSRTLSFVFRRGYFRFEAGDYEGYQVEGPDGRAQPFELPPALTMLKAWGIMPRLRVNTVLNVNGQFFLREVPIYDEARRGFEVRLSPEVTYRPTAQLQLQLNYTYSEISRRSTRTVVVERPSAGVSNGASSVSTNVDLTRDTPYSTVHIPRLRIQYQFSKDVFARAVGQYELARSEALTDPITGRLLLVDGERVAAESTGEFQGQFLVQYEPSPGTIFYVGYSRLMEGRRTLSLDRLDPVQEGLFVKLSYLFRM